VLFISLTIALSSLTSNAACKSCMYLCMVVSGVVRDTPGERRRLSEGSAETLASPCSVLNSVLKTGDGRTGAVVGLLGRLKALALEAERSLDFR
jgi:hypothetical protein